MINKFLILSFFLLLFFIPLKIHAALNVILETGEGTINFNRQTIFQTIPAGTMPEGFISRLDIQSQQINGGLNNPYTISLCQGTLNETYGQLYAQRHCGSATIVAQKLVNFTSTGTTTVNFLKRYAVHAGTTYYWVMAGGQTSTSSLSMVWSRSKSTSMINGRLCGTNNYSDDYCSSVTDNVFALYDDTSLPFSWQIGTTYINLTRPVSTTTPVAFTAFDGWIIEYGLTGAIVSNYYNYDLYADIVYHNTDRRETYYATSTGLARFLGKIGSYDVQADVNYGYEWTTSNYRPQYLGNYIATTTLWAKGAVNRYQIAATTTIFNLATTTTEYGRSGWCVGICDDLATSSIAADLICAGRMTFCFIFIPHDSSLNYLDNSYTDFKKTFPFNTLFSLTDTLKNAISSTTLTQNDTFGIPFIEKTATGSKFIILPVLASSSLPATIGATNALTFKTTIGYIFWAATAFGIAFILF